MNKDEEFMGLAIDEAKQARIQGDWPFGAIVARNGDVVGKGKASDKSSGDVTDHAELMAIREACKTLHTNDLRDCVIYCTNEPCLMCAAGIFQANISTVYIGASRDDLPDILRPRKIRIEDLARDSGHRISIHRGLLKEQVVKLFHDVKKKLKSPPV